jgi:hypothetical protein
MFLIRSFAPGKKRALAEALDRHTEALIHGQDNADRMPDRSDQPAPELEGLFRLADRVYATLAPVEPSEDFVSDLKTKLFEMQSGELKSRQTWLDRRANAVRVSRILGVAVSTLAVAAFAARILASLLMLLAFIANRRRKTTAHA